MPQEEGGAHQAGLHNNYAVIRVDCNGGPATAGKNRLRNLYLNISPIHKCCCCSVAFLFVQMMLLLFILYNVLPKDESHHFSNPQGVVVCPL